MKNMKDIWINFSKFTVQERNISCYGQSSLRVYSPEKKNSLCVRTITVNIVNLRVLLESM